MVAQNVMELVGLLTEIQIQKNKLFLNKWMMKSEWGLLGGIPEDERWRKNQYFRTRLISEFRVRYFLSVKPVIATKQNYPVKMQK